MRFKRYKRPGKQFFDMAQKSGGLEKAVMLRGYGCEGWCFPLRGGYWNNGSDAGLGALYLADLRSIVNNNVGFRPALPLSQKSGLYGGRGSVAAESSAEGKRSHIPSPRNRGENIDRHGRLVGVPLTERGRIPSMPLFRGAEA